MAYKLKKQVGYALAATLISSLGMAAGASAEEWKFGDASLNITSTASFGAGMRTNNPDGDLIAVSNGGRDTTVAAENFDDGNLNFRRGDLFTTSIRMIHEADLRWHNFGAFLSVGYFYDFINNDADSTRRTDLSSSTRSLAGRGFDLYDAYVYGDFDVGDAPLNVRLGNQVINWGESLFRGGGISQTNALDLSKLVIPGTKIREGYLPSPMIYANFGIFPNVSLEAYYQFKWRETELVPVGTFQSTEDLVGDGAQGMFFAGDPGGVGSAAYFAYAPRLQSDEPKDSGQYGVAARYYAENIATELSAYYLRYHSKTPYVSGAASPFAPPLFITGYYSYFPEDIDLYGLSASFPLGPVAIGAEVAYQPNYPVMYSDAVTAALTDAFTTFAPSRVNGYTPIDRTNFIVNAALSIGPSLPYIGQVPGWIGADSIDLVGEAGVVSFRGDKPAVVQGDMSAWGFTTVASATYSNAIMSGLTLTPSISFDLGVNGVAIDRGSAGTPVEGKGAVTVGVAANYQSALTTSLSYTNNFGGKLVSRSSDRDYITLSASYSF